MVWVQYHRVCDKQIIVPESRIAFLDHSHDITVGDRGLVVELALEKAYELPASVYINLVRVLYQQIRQVLLDGQARQGRGEGADSLGELSFVYREMSSEEGFFDAPARQEPPQDPILDVLSLTEELEFGLLLLSFGFFRTLHEAYGQVNCPLRQTPVTQPASEFVAEVGGRRVRRYEDREGALRAFSLCACMYACVLSHEPTETDTRTQTLYMKIHNLCWRQFDSRYTRTNHCSILSHGLSIKGFDTNN